MGIDGSAMVHSQVPVLEAHDLISRFDVGLVITDEDEDKVEELAFKWTELKQLAEDANDHLQSRSPEFRSALQKGLRTLAADVAVCVSVSRVAAGGDGGPGELTGCGHVHVAGTRTTGRQAGLTRQGWGLHELDSCWPSSTRGLPPSSSARMRPSELVVSLGFCCHATPTWTDLRPRCSFCARWVAHVRSPKARGHAHLTLFLVVYLVQLYALYSDASAMLMRHRSCPWTEVSVDAITADVDRSLALCSQQPPDAQVTGCFKALTTTLEDIKAVLPLVALLRHETVRRRHWLALREIMGAQLPIAVDRAADPNPFPLSELLEVRTPVWPTPTALVCVWLAPDLVRLVGGCQAPLLRYRAAIESMCAGARKEADVEAKLVAVRQEWSFRAFQVGPINGRQVLGLVSADTADLLSSLDEAQITLSALQGSRYVGVSTTQSIGATCVDTTHCAC